MPTPTAKRDMPQSGMHFKPKRRKKTKIKPPTKEQAVEYLRKVGLRGLIQGGGVWMAVDEESRFMLDMGGFGHVDGGVETAKETHSTLSLPSSDRKVPTASTSAVLQTISTEQNDTSAVPQLTSIRLGLEEALWMAWADGTLTVLEGDAGSVVILGVEELWQRALKHRQTFPVTYAAYHHFRSKGFIPRSGLQYGGDLVIYRRHPSDCHSDACVRIVSSSDTAAPQMPSWHDISASARLCAAVSKGLLLLFVHQLPGTDLSNLGCLNRFQASMGQVTTILIW